VSDLAPPAFASTATRPLPAYLLLPQAYGDLRRLAEELLRYERPDHTLQATALVHEAYLRLSKQRSPGWNGRADFLRVVVKLMRRILVDHARVRDAKKRSGDTQPIDPALLVFEERAIDTIALDEALDALGAFDARKRDVVELRFIGGLALREVSAVLGVPLRTVERDWTVARAWLRARLGEAR